MHLFPKTHIDFLGMRWKFFFLSAIILGASIVSLIVRPVRYGIDFTGGLAIQLTFEKSMDLGELRSAADKVGWKNAGIQSYTGSNTFSLRAHANANQSAELLEKQLQELQLALPDNKFKVDSQSFVGPSVGKHLARQAAWSIVLSLGCIIAYLGLRFSNPVWGVAGIVALFHDILATYGLFSLIGAEVDLLIISAILTIGGYSIHDTIVIFDRMREKMRHMHKEPLDQIMNESMNETLSRTVITSGTVLVVVSILFIFGGEVIHHFAMAMVFGAVVGTYSSIAVAAPLAYQWSTRGGAGARPAGPAQGVRKPKPAGKN